MEFEVDPLVDGNKTFDIFDVEFHMLNKNMWQEVLKVIKFFLEFLKTFDSNHVHNMLVLMLDPRFKIVKVVKSFVGCGNPIHFTIEYDVKEVTPFFMKFFY
jgi:hypothetical protein